MSKFFYYIIGAILTFFLTPFMCYFLDNHDRSKYDKGIVREILYIVPLIWPLWIGFVLIYIFLDVIPIKIANLYTKLINLIIDLPEKLFEKKKND